jgi:glycosyltransferase involved in cell wall biosynthesis
MSYEDLAKTERSPGFQQENREEVQKSICPAAIRVSIHILTHNAPDYVQLTIRSVVERTPNPAYDIVVLDNGSQAATKRRLLEMRRVGYVQRMKFLNRNSLFAEGNNIAALMARDDASHFLLLNSDVEIRHPDWLAKLLHGHRKGISAYGVVEEPWLRADGWCLLIDSDLYRKYRLDESYQWWWSITKLQAQILKDGYSVRAFVITRNTCTISVGGAGKSI